MLHIRCLAQCLEHNTPSEMQLSRLQGSNCTCPQQGTTRDFFLSGASDTHLMFIEHLTITKVLFNLDKYL